VTRPLRIQYPGALYHITCRGNEQRDIFRDDTDREKFLEILSESAFTYSIKLYSYVLMTNHFHILLETPLANLGEFMRRFNITYTGHFNKRHKRVGHLYQGRYKSILIEKESYLTILSRYIHLNPVRISALNHKPAREKLRYLKAYKWSSLKGYMHCTGCERFIDYGLVLEEYGGDNNKGRQAYMRRLTDDITGSLEVKGDIVVQSILGGEEFIAWVKDNFFEEIQRDRECPSLNELRRYHSKEKIIDAIEQEYGKSMEELKEEGGTRRQVAIDLLCRLGGLKGREVGDYFGVDYSTVSVSRKLLRKKLEKDRELQGVIGRLEKGLSIIKN